MRHDGRCAMQHLEDALYASPIEPLTTWTLWRMLQQAKVEARECSVKWAGR